MKTIRSAFLLFALALFANPALAALINAAAAEDDHTSSPVSTTNFRSGSVHCTWAGLTGTLDAEVVVEVSNDEGATWVQKGNATFDVTTADGSNSISLNNVVTEAKYQVRWVSNGVTDGTVTCNAYWKV
jgi:hypothetical protein